MRKMHIILILVCMIIMSFTSCNTKSSHKEGTDSAENAEKNVVESTDKNSLENSNEAPETDQENTNYKSELGGTNYMEEKWMKDIVLTRAYKSANYANPLLAQIFCADPTSVEYNGRLYVYATNDNQQYLANNKGGKNTYEKIKSLVVISTDDMVNWTYHGEINVGEISPWIYASWAPSIVAREEEDGLTHFYLYFSNSGFGVGVLTATNPLGPWTDPIGTNIVAKGMPTLGECEAPFDPGVVIDEKGIGWLSFGGGDSKKPENDYYPGNARIVQLGEDMISLASDIVTIPAPYHFEANELNYINGTWVYTYNTSWKEREAWDLEGVAKPSACCMSYMTTKTPLVSDSWIYQNNYVKNPGECGLGYSNNHTHLQKFKGKYYILFHSMLLQTEMGFDGGYRSVCINEVNVNEEMIKIDMAIINRKGVTQLQNVNAFDQQQAATNFTSAGMNYVKDLEHGIIMGDISSGDWMCMKGVDFSEGAQLLKAVVKGTGKLLVRIDDKEKNTVAVMEFDSDNWTEITEKLSSKVSGVHDVYFVFVGENCEFAQWMFN